jgi:hypothetical protein
MIFISGLGSAGFALDTAAGTAGVRGAGAFEVAGAGDIKVTMGGTARVAGDGTGSGLPAGCSGRALPMAASDSMVKTVASVYFMARHRNVAMSLQLTGAPGQVSGRTHPSALTHISAWLDFGVVILTA